MSICKKKYRSKAYLYNTEASAKLAKWAINSYLEISFFENVCVFTGLNLYPIFKSYVLLHRFKRLKFHQAKEIK